MEPDILARQCNSLKWYCFSDYWSKTSPGISKQKVLLPSKYIYIYIYIIYVYIYIHIYIHILTYIYVYIYNK